MGNLLTKIENRLENFFLSRADERQLRVHAEMKKGKQLSNQIDMQQESMQVQTLREWKTALLMATDPQYPDRSLLQTLYDNLLLDNHLASIIESRILHSQRAPFKIIDSNNNEIDELSALFRRPWFEDFVKMALEVRFRGTQLIELFELDERTGELKEVELIPMGHFNPVKGIIIKQLGDENGWNYNQTPLSRFYLQVGKDRDLGMLAKIAPIVLGKKMGWGSWLDYLDKYGVGNLFVTTEHQNMAALKRLENAARNFKANGWMVTNGNETFEIKGNEAGNPQNFDLLMDRANSEMSKRVLGGAGLTDERSFVGSAEIQFKLAEDRYNSDLLLLENLINQELIPRLVTLSPIYAPLANTTFEFRDKPEDLKDLRDTVAALAPHFRMDVEEVSQRLGITLLDQKDNTGITDNGIQKKKPEIDAHTQRSILYAELDSFYNDVCCLHEHSLQALDFSKWDELIDQVAKQMHEGKLKPQDLNVKMIQTTYDELNDAAHQGYGKDWISFPSDGKGTLPNELKKNIYMFSGAKAYSQLMELNDLLYDKNGKLRPYNQYEVLAKKNNRKYNKNWLQAEWQTAKTAAQMAQKWEQIQATKDLFPNLEFRTVGDDRVRPAHEKLDGIIKPIDDEFWSTHYPPLDWRCRCDAVPTAADPKGEIPEDTPSPMFDGNVGKDAEIFTKKHNFFRLIRSDENAKRNMETFKLFSKSETFKTPNGNKIKINPFRDEKDYNDNLKRGLMMVDKLGIDVELRPDVKDWKNPEYRLNGLIADLYKGDIKIGLKEKRIQIKGFVNEFNSKYPKTPLPSDYAIVFDISGLQIKYDIARYINGRFKSGRKLNFLVIINDEKLVKIDRGDSFESIKEKLSLLKAKEKR